MNQNQLVANDINATYKLDNGEQINLNIDVVRNVIAKGDNITNSEIFSFIKLCQYQKLNPFLGEAYLIKFGTKNPAQLVVGKDVFTNRLNEHPQCTGWQPGLILQKSDGTIEERNGSFYLKGEEKIVGAWIKISRKDWKNSFHWSVPLSEFYREYENKQGKMVPMGQWGTMKAQMIIKCAITSGARNVFPKSFQGMYGEEEMGVETNENVIDIDYKSIKKDPEQKQKINQVVTKEDIEKIYDVANSDIIKIDSKKAYELIVYTLTQLIKAKKLPEKTQLNNLKKDKVDLVIKQTKANIKAFEAKYKKEEENKKEAKNKKEENKKDAKFQEMNYESEGKEDEKTKK